jgi:bifunctional non-homologous end joining protein LigD
MAVPRAKPTQSSARRLRRARRASAAEELIPRGENQLEVNIDGRKVRLTNLNKPFWPDLGITKGDLLRYYFEISPYLLPHLVGRAMVLKRYPNGAFGDFFFQKRAPEPRPDWIEICSIQHTAGPVHFAVVRDLASLLWGVNLGAIDLNPWYARCDDTMRPDYLHFDLDPVEGENFERVCETAEVVHEALGALKIPNYAKTTGSRGIHVYVPIVRGPVQKEVWTFAKARATTRENAARAHYCRIPHRKPPERARASGLQSKRLGPDTSVSLFGPTQTACAGIHSRHLGGNPPGRSHRGFSAR